ncbi:MAG: hypothetical protein LBU98_03685 [Alistipes sp.]|jgi:hypothetical protein|nr:hypothetical protein [Alistipes sp.]
MKRVKPLVWGVLLAGVWMLASSDVMPDRYGGWAPYFMQRADLERSVKMAPEAREMVDPGKLWIAGDKIYVVERYKGVHIIDNSDPANPRPTGFLIAPGCMDVALRGDVIYLDNAVDLVAFDLSTGAETSRLRNYFPPPASPVGDRYHNFDYGSSDMIPVGWKRVVREGKNGL